MDLSTTSESIIPPPMKKLKPEISAPPKLTNPYSKYKQTTSIASTDDALNASSFNRALVPTVFQPPTIATESHKSGKSTAHQLAYEDSRRRKGDSKATAYHEPDRGMSRKHQVRCNATVCPLQCHPQFMCFYDCIKGRSWELSNRYIPPYTVCIAGNFGEVFNLANRRFCGKSPNLKLANIISYTITLCRSAYDHQI